MAPPTALWEHSGSSLHTNVTAVFAITMKGFYDAAAPTCLTLMQRVTPPPAPSLTLKPPPYAGHCIAHNCLSPSQHGHSVGLGSASFTCHTPPAAKVCTPLPHPWPIPDGHFIGLLLEHGRIWALFAKIHQRICVTPSYFLSSRCSF